MKVSFYGKLTAMVGRDVELAIETPCTIVELRNHIAEAYPVAAQTLRDDRSWACIDNVPVADEHSVDATQHVEFLSPVSGG